MKSVNTLIVGGGQAGLAMSAHLSSRNMEHIVLERERIAERWRSHRWDSLVANGPAWHDRFPAKEFATTKADDFATRADVVTYFEQFAQEINAPIRCGEGVIALERAENGSGFMVKSTAETYHAQNVVVATGPFQVPVIPPLIPQTPALTQIHSTSYKNPQSLNSGSVLIVGAGSSGSQIADELLRSGREVYLSIGPHERPPRRYRGKDFVWWLGVLGKWEMKTPPKGREHVTIAVSGAYGGRTIDFRAFAERGMTLLGMTKNYQNGTLHFADDLTRNIEEGDKNYLSLLQEADEYITREGLDFPLEEDAKHIRPAPPTMREPILSLDLKERNITTVIWATGFKQDFDWLHVDAFDEAGKPLHQNGISKQAGLYFLGLPWLSMRGSSFIWGVWEDAKRLSDHINAAQDNITDRVNEHA